MTYTPGLVSVVTPCYNAALFVAETIESVAVQTYPRVEHIVVDDGSSDGSLEVIRRYDQRVQVAPLPQNRGAAHARNRGAALARGEFLMFLDADDLISREAIHGLVAAVRSHPGAAAVCAWRRLRQTVSSGPWEVVPSDIPFPPPPDPLYGWLTGVWVPPCAVLWRRDAYERAGGWDESITVNDDGDLMMRALARGVRLLTATLGEAWYREHALDRGSLSNTNSEQGLRSQLRVYQNVAAEVARLDGAASYAHALGMVLHGLGMVALHRGHPELARACFRDALRYGDRRSMARTWPGRVLVSVLGLERKERVAVALAKLGFVTARRRYIIEPRRSRPRTAPPGDELGGADR
jgi:GT2 family glycosyltransferase